MLTSDHPAKQYQIGQLLFWILVAFFDTTRMTYPEQSGQTKPYDWNEPENIRQILNEAEKINNLPIGPSHIIAYHESRPFDPNNAQSKYVGGYRSRGLMQIYFKYQKSIVAKYSTIPPGQFVWYNPEHSANAGCGYLAYLINRFGGSVYLGRIGI